MLIQYWMYAMGFMAIAYLVSLAVFLAGSKRDGYDLGLRVINSLFFVWVLLGLVINTFAVTNAWVQLGRMPMYRDALQSGLEFRYIFNHYWDELIIIATNFFTTLFCLPTLAINALWFYHKRKDRWARFCFKAILAMIICFVCYILSPLSGYVSMLYD